MNIDIKDVPKIKASFTNFDKKRIKKLKLGNNIRLFNKTIKKQININYLNLFYNNLKTLKTYKPVIFKKNIITPGLSGYYDYDANKVFVRKLNKESLTHELLHAASTYYDKKNKIVFSGFYQIDKNSNKNLGIGLTEGYTSLLDENIFKKEKNLSKKYIICKDMAHNLENIVGIDKMRKYYFTADLKSLINELKNYDKEENIIKFLENMDYILYHKNKLSSILEKENMLFLEKWFLNKDNNKKLKLTK